MVSEDELPESVFDLTARVEGVTAKRLSEGDDVTEQPEAPILEPREGLPSLDELEGPELELDALGPELERTLRLLNEVGFTT